MSGTDLGTFKALMVSEVGSDVEEVIAKNLKLVSLPRQPCEPSQIRISIRAAAVNFFDNLIFIGKYQSKPPFPFVPCFEAAGVVTEVGSDVVKQYEERRKRGEVGWDFQVGDHVIVSPTSGGGAAEEILIEPDFCFPLPKNLSFAQGAAFVIGYMTAYHALVHRGELKKGETLLITGAGGGMGVAAVQLAKILGAKVIAGASDDTKLSILSKLGADHVINYKKENLRDRVAQITNHQFCDVIFENVGGDIFDQCVRCIAGKGRLLVIGFASGTIPKLPVNLVLVKGFSLVGVRSGAQLGFEPELSKSMWIQLIKLASEGKLVPYVGQAFPSEQAAEAFRSLLTRQIIGKAVITFNTPTPKL